MDLSLLKKPFPVEDIEWRIAQCGKTEDGRIWAKVLAYITSRAVHDRLDEVVGPDNWQMRYSEWKNGAICEIGIKVGNEWVWKSGGGDPTDYEAFKGMLSSAEKRAGVPWGIGRYLYNLKEDFAECMPSQTGKRTPEGYHRGYGEENKKKFYFWWKPPQLPAWALPEGAKGQKKPAQQQEPPQTQPEPEQPKEPQNGKQSRVLDDKQRAAAGLIVSKYINELVALLRSKGIDKQPERWKEWLKDTYNFPDIMAIQTVAYAGIVKFVKEHSDRIINYQKQEEPPVEAVDTNFPF